MDVLLGSRRVPNSCRGRRPGFRVLNERPVTVAAQRWTHTSFHLYALASGLTGHRDDIGLGRYEYAGLYHNLCKYQQLQISGQCVRQAGGWQFLASTDILSGPQRREIAAALAFRLCAQGRDGSASQRKGGRHRAEWAKLTHDPVYDAARRPTGKKICERSVVGRRLGERVAMHGARRGFRTAQIGRTHLDANRAEGERGSHPR
jgi:hypothetical protein